MTSTFLPTTRVASPDHVHARVFDDELVILDLERGCYFGLDSVGTRLWQSMMDGASVEEVVARLEGEYDTSREQMLADFLALGSEWLARGLVQVKETP